MGRDDGRSMTAEEWTAFWGDPDMEEQGKCYTLPKMYPGPRVRCPMCGFWQGNEAVLDTYRWCMRCCAVLQDPRTLYWGNEPAGLGPFRVVAASYGHPRDPKLAFDVRQQLQGRVGVSDRLNIKREEDLTVWLGNPCPGVRKTLRIRYVSLEGVAQGRRREVWLQEVQEGHLEEAVSLVVSTSLPLVIVFSAEYGSPAGSSRGRGTFDVTEFMQGRVDQGGGRYLFLSKNENLTKLFGDPCPGREKCLTIHYEILGTEGKVEALESDGHLITPVSISSTPILAPLIVIESATYGQTAIGIDERLRAVQKELSNLLSLQNHKDTGMPVSRDDNRRLMRIRPLIAELDHLEGVTPKHVDVTSLVQRRVEEFGGGVIEFVAGKDDLNRLFGNPLPRQRKELRVPYLVTGHDSERETSLEEVTTSGYPRNFILQRRGHVVVQAKDDRMGRGILEENVLVDSPKVLPVIEILGSSYGHPRNTAKVYDISTKLRSMIDRQGGEKLEIDCDTDLRKLFDEPCRGVRKKIKISYIARGLHGRMRVNERDGRLIADVIVGYYSREGFKSSELVGTRYGLDPRSPPEMIILKSAAPFAAGATTPDAAKNRGNTDNAREFSQGNSADLESVRFEEPEVKLDLPLLTPLNGGQGGDQARTAEGTAKDLLATSRRLRRKKRQERHQAALHRRKEEGCESERRQL